MSEALEDVKKGEVCLVGVEDIRHKADRARHPFKEAVGAVWGACLLELLSVHKVVELYGSVQVLWVFSHPVQDQEHISRPSNTVTNAWMKKENYYNTSEFRHYLSNLSIPGLDTPNRGLPRQGY